MQGTIQTRVLVILKNILWKILRGKSENAMEFYTLRIRNAFLLTLKNQNFKTKALMQIIISNSLFDLLQSLRNIIEKNYL